MEAIDKAILFNSIIVVLWTVAILPLLLQKQKSKTIISVFVVIFVVEVYLQSPLHEFPFEFLGGLLMVGMSFLGGHIMLRYSNQHNNGEES